MFDRISVTVALASIVAVLAKFVELIKTHSTSKDEHAFLHSLIEFDNVPIFRSDSTMVAVLIFLMFMRGKMMHDDHQYFLDIEKGRYRDVKNRMANRFGLFFGYLSWLAWAPAIFYFPSWNIFGGCMVAAFMFSTIWSAIDLGIIPESSPRFNRKKQYGWIIFNILYIFLFAAIGFCPAYGGMLRLICAVTLLVVLLIDWLFSDPIASVIEAIPDADRNR
jgi:hypothetical protein